MERDDLYIIPIEGLDSYRITKTGKIWSSKVKKFLKTRVYKGYEKISLNGTDHNIHRLLALTFVPRPHDKDTVNHINSVNTDNRLENLEWVTQKENVNKSEIDTSHPRKVLQIDRFTNQVVGTFNTVTEAGKHVGLTRAAISKACLGVNNTAGGYYWKFEDDKYNHEVVDVGNARKVYDYNNYFIFEDGRVYNIQRKAFLKSTGLADSPYITLCKGGKKRNCYIRRLLRDHFPENITHTNEDSDTKSVGKPSDGSS
jgi:hypothetical protein